MGLEAQLRSESESVILDSKAKFFPHQCATRFASGTEPVLLD
jgi:hypothetical protein